jgi:uncharacterized protein (TIGR02268 family)
MGTGAAAQTSARELRSRRVVLSDSFAASVPEIRVATGVVTTITFEDAVIDARALQLEGRGSRVKLVAADEHAIVLKLLVEPTPGERLVLHVPFADGKAPTQATFALVSASSEVDSQVEVVREAQSAEACHSELVDAKAILVQKEAELAVLRAREGVNGPAGLILAGMLGEGGVRAMRSLVSFSPDVRHGLRVVLRSALSFRASEWAAVSLEVRNAGEEPWSPGMAKLTSMKTGKPVTVVSVSMRHAQLAPGESVLVVVETVPPPANAGEEFTLELFGADGGRALSINGVRVHNAEEQKP